MPKRSLVIAIFHASLKTISRSQGHSAIAAAAYLMGNLSPVPLKDERLGISHDFTRRKGVAAVSVFLPAGAPAWMNDPARLWNAAEAMERVNGRVARELVVALPAELDANQRGDLVADLARMLVETYRVAVMAATHAPDRKGDARNHHVHLLFSTRVVTADGLGQKTRILDDQKTGPIEVDAIRVRVANITNQHLIQARWSERVDHRGLLAQSIAAEVRGDMAAAVLLAREPTTHVGRPATAASRRGEHADRSAWNDDVRFSNTANLAQFLAAAQAEGRAMETPARSGADQAREDRAREAHAAPTPASAPKPSRQPMRRGAGPLAAFRKLGTPVGRAGRAYGADAALLNSAAEQVGATLNVEADLAKQYQNMMEQIVKEFGQRSLDAVNYARVLRWPFVDIEALAKHQRQYPQCDALLRQGVKTYAAWQRAAELPMRRRDRYGEAMVSTVRERRQWEGIDQTPQPPAWKKRTRRQWAELRRQQRAGLEHAEHRERRAQMLITPDAMAQYANKAQNARDALDQIEATRRARYPVPGDHARLSATRKRPQGEARPVVTRRPEQEQEPANARPNGDTMPPHDRDNLGTKPAPTRRQQPGR